MKKKACRKCKMMVKGDECQICKGDSFSTNWKGRVFVIDPDKSQIAQKIGLKEKGGYAIKVP